MQKLPMEMCGHFFRPEWSIKVRVLIEMPMPHDAEHGDQVVHGVVRHTPIPSPALSTLASLKPKFSSRSSSSFELIERETEKKIK